MRENKAVAVIQKSIIVIEVFVEGWEIRSCPWLRPFDAQLFKHADFIQGTGHRPTTRIYRNDLWGTARPFRLRSD